MASYNKVVLVGNLTRDPRLSYTTTKTPVVEIGLAVNEKYKAKDGTEKSNVCFIDCFCFSKAAEVLNKYMSKGSQILIEGRLDFSQWTDNNGNNRSKHKVYIEKFQFLGDNRKKDESNEEHRTQSKQGSPAEQDLPF